MNRFEQKSTARKLVRIVVALLLAGSVTAGVRAAVHATGPSWSDRVYAFLIAGDIPVVVFAGLAVCLGASWLYWKTRSACVQSVRNYFIQHHPDRTIRRIRIHSSSSTASTVAVIHGYQPPIYQYYKVDTESGQICELASSTLIPMPEGDLAG